MTRLALLGRPGCHLCDEARQALARVAEITGERWTEVDITGDPELEAKYLVEIPVILLDGEVHGSWRVDEQRLVRDLLR